MRLPLVESRIQSSILKYLDSIGAFSFKVIASSRSGIPDIVAIVDGRHLFLEVKRPKGKVSALQSSKLRAIEKAGGEAYVVYSVDDVKSILGSSKYSWQAPYK